MNDDNIVIQSVAVSIFAAWVFNYTFMGVLVLTGFIVSLHFLFKSWRYGK